MNSEPTKRRANRRRDRMGCISWMRGEDSGVHGGGALITDPSEDAYQARA